MSAIVPLNSKHWSPDRNSFTSLPSLANLMTEQVEEGSEVGVETKKNPSPVPRSPRISKPGSETSQQVRLFRGKSIYAEQLISPALKRSNSQIAASLEAEKMKQIALSRRMRRQSSDVVALKDAPNLANMMTEGDELSSSSSSSSESESGNETGTTTTAASSVVRGGTIRSSSTVISRAVSIPESRRSVRQPPSRSLSSSDSRTQSTIREPGTKSRSPSLLLSAAAASPKPPDQKLTPTGRTRTRTVREKRISSPRLQPLRQEASGEDPNQTQLDSLPSHEVLLSGKFLDESVSEVMSTLVDSSESQLLVPQQQHEMHQQQEEGSVEHVGTPVISQLSYPSLLPAESIDSTTKTPSATLEKGGGGNLGFLFPPQEEDEEREKEKKWLLHKPNKRQEVRARVKEQQRQWALESERVLESLVSRMDPEIGLHVRRRLRGKRRRGRHRERGTRKNHEVIAKESESLTSSSSEKYSKSLSGVDSSDTGSESESDEDSRFPLPPPSLLGPQPLLPPSTVIPQTPQVRQIARRMDHHNCRRLRRMPSCGLQMWRGR
jgi:hypothetical protein